MAEFQIKDEDLNGLQGKVAVVTGGSSGIGLATLELLSSLGAIVISGDIQQPPAHGDFLFVHTDVRSWSDLNKLFKAAKNKYGRIDHVFANAGIGPRADYLNLTISESGEPEEPNKDTLDINLSSVVNTVTLGAHYMKSQAEGGSIVIMGSSTGLHNFRSVDYSTAKAGIIGLGRSFARLVEVAGLPLRINTLAPSWTATQVLPDLKGLLDAVSQTCQSPLVVARVVAYLMASQSRHGDLIFVSDGKYTEVEKSVLRPAYDSMRGNSLSNDEVMGKVLALGSQITL